MTAHYENPLNILHTIDLEKLYPIIRCQLCLSDEIDVDRLSRSIELVAQVVPEIYCKYNPNKNQWVQVINNPKQIINIVNANTNIDELPLDWLKEPQLNIYIQKKDQLQYLTFIISHIMTDAGGFKQLLYLLCDCYNNGESAIENKKNNTDIDWLNSMLENTQRVSKKNIDHPSDPLLLPNISEAAPGIRHHIVSAQTLEPVFVKRLIKATHIKGVTVNDVFLAAYGKTLQNYNPHNPHIAMACPTDMRQFSPHTNQLRVANHTARYNIDIYSPQNADITETVKKVHEQLAMLKQNFQFLDSIRELIKNSRVLDSEKLRNIVQQNYHVREIAYTNLGVVDSSLLKFDKTSITQCIMTGSFREAPMFQVAFSTYANNLTLAFNMIGDSKQVEFGNQLLTQVIDNIRQFVSLVEK